SDHATACYEDVPVGVHEQAVLLRSPPEAGAYDLEVVLIAGDSLILGEPASAPVVVRPRKEGSTRTAPTDLLASSGRDGAASTFPDRDERLRWLRDHVRIRPLHDNHRADSDSHLAIEIDCDRPYDDSGVSEVLVTHHWKRGSSYVAWDVRRHLLAGLQRGRQIRTIPVDRPADPELSIEVAALVPMAGYVRLFSENDVERAA